MPPRNTPSLAKSFHQRFLDSGNQVAFLRNLVNSDPLTFETDWLEFKPYPHRNPDDTIKEIWSKDISAFANTQGGVLIWGIQARHVRRVDAARGFRLVPDPDELRTRLYELHHQATDPPLSEIIITPVSDPNEGGRGFVVCFIPQGSFVPYRAEYCNKNYYMRYGDDSIVPPPVVLRRLFYPQSLARIEMSVVLTKSQQTLGDASVDKMRYQVFLMNSGLATAHDVYVVAHDNVNYSRPEGKGLIHSHNWHMREGSPNKSGFSSTIPLHPGFSTQVATSYEWSPEKHVIDGTLRQIYKQISMWFSVYCRDTDCQALEVEFTREDQVSGRCEKQCKRLEP
jgi:hypothetical protein